MTKEYSSIGKKVVFQEDVQRAVMLGFEDFERFQKEHETDDINVLFQLVKKRINSLPFSEVVMKIPKGLA